MPLNVEPKVVGRITYEKGLTFEGGGDILHNREVAPEADGELSMVVLQKMNGVLLSTSCQKKSLQAILGFLLKDVSY